MLKKKIELLIKELQEDIKWYDENGYDETDNVYTNVIEKIEMLEMLIEDSEA